MSSTLARYTDRRVLITGGGSGIGQATVLRILDEGGRVVAADISEAGLADTVRQGRRPSTELSTVRMDVGDESSVREGVAQAVDAAGGLDTLVNAAGILRSSHFVDTTLADFETILRINLIGTFLVTREAIPALRQGNAAAVVNFSSTSASFAHPYMSAYAASKGGIQAMTHALALEFSKERIRFNCVQPGSISSGMTDGVGESARASVPACPPTWTSRCSARSRRCCRSTTARCSPSPTRWPAWWRCSVPPTPTGSPAPKCASTVAHTCSPGPTIPGSRGRAGIG